MCWDAPTERECVSASNAGPRLQYTSVNMRATKQARAQFARCGAWLVAALALTAPAQAATKPYDVVEVPLTQVVADLAANKTTSVAVTQAYIARIHALDAPYKSVIVIA